MSSLTDDQRSGFASRVKAEINTLLARYFDTNNKLFIIKFFSYTYNPTRKFYSSYYKLNHPAYTNSTRSKSLSGESHDERQVDIDFKMPEMKAIFTAYYVTSTITHFFSFFHSIALIMIYESYWDLKLELNCYIPGRLSLHKDAVKLVPYFQLISNALHMIWRYLNVHYESSYRLDGVIFLLSNEDSYRQQLGREIDVDRSTKSNSIARGSSRNYLRDVLYLKIKFNENHSQSFLRPNRTVEAREKLVKIVDTIMIRCLVIAALLCCLVYPIILAMILLDSGYIENYPTCSPELEKLKAEGRLGPYSMTFWPPNHRLICLLFDAFINLFTYVDDLVALIFPASLSLILTADLMIYWNHIDSKLNSLLLELKSFQINMELNQADGSMPTRFCTTKWRARSSAAGIHGWDHTDDRLCKEIQILQAQIIDFFKQLRYYDKYVSLLITFLFQIWITMFVVTSYMAIKLDDTYTLTVIRVIQLYGCAALSGPVYGLLRLRRRTKNTYIQLCGIVAYENSHKFKSSWSTILEFYTHKANYGFSILHKFPLTWMSYLRCIATSISVLVVIETFGKF